MRYIWVVFSFIAFICLSFSAFSQEIAESQLFIEIQGLSGQPLNNSKNLLSIYEYHKKKAPGEARIRYLHNLAQREFRRALSPYGYYKYTLNSQLEKKADNHWYATYTITLEDPIKIRNIQVEITGPGADDRAFDFIINQLPIAEGKVLRHDQYETAKSQLRQRASERGYYQADFKRSELRIDIADYVADIIFILDTGPRYKFGDISISEGHLEQDLVERFIGFKKGDYISARELLDLQLGFANSNYFGRVEVQPLWNEASDDHLVPIRVDYEPNKRTHYQAGVGYGTDTGARITLEQNRRWVNTLGHRFTSHVQASRALNSLGANYIFPGVQPQSDQYILRFLWTDENTRSIRSERFVYGASWQSEREQVQRIISLDWQEEKDWYEGGFRKTKYLIPSAQWTKVQTWNRLNVNNGWRLSTTIRGASQSILSDTDFLQILASAKYIRRVAPKTRILLRGEGGTSLTSNFANIPTSLRFYAGGDQSIRGYAYRSVSPRNELDEPVGARNLAVGSFEVDYLIKPNWRIATFIDSGNTFNDVREAFKVGVGFGFRWQTPIGPVRLDLASGLSDPGDRFRLHFTIGPDL